MKALNGLSCNKDFSKFTKVSDLIYYDGPLLSHYISERGDDYLYYWVDVNDTCNRWIICRTDIQTLQNYLDKKISLRSIITDPNDGFVFIVDIDNDIKYTNQQIVPISLLPEEYKPTENS